jgi:hypothetical protein
LPRNPASIRGDQSIESGLKVQINENSPWRILYTGEVCKFVKYWYERLSEGEMLVYLKGDRRFGRSRHRLEDDINECHREIGRESVDCLAVGGDLSGELFTTVIMP